MRAGVMKYIILGETQNCIHDVSIRRKSTEIISRDVCTYIYIYIYIYNFMLKKCVIFLSSFVLLPEDNNMKVLVAMMWI